MPSIAALVLGEYSLTATQQREFEAKFKDDQTSGLTIVSNNFQGALAYFTLARKSGRKDDLRQAKKYMRRIWRHCCAGSPPYNAMINVLNAELDARLGKIDAAIEGFRIAANSFKKQNCFLFRAVILEFAGNNCLLHEAFEKQAIDFLKESYETYEDYGAFVKLDLLKREYPRSTFPNLVSAKLHKLGLRLALIGKKDRRQAPQLTKFLKVWPHYGSSTCARRTCTAMSIGFFRA